jgi:hypothetical protein
MSRHLLRLAAFAAAILTAGVSFADEDVLYWMIDSNATVEKDGVTSSVSSFFDNYGAPANSAFAARVRVTGGNIQEGQDVFLDLYIPGYGLDEGGGAWGVEFSTVGGYWGAGVPTGNQSPSGDYSAGTPEYSFIVELGNIDSSDNWTTVATSAAKAYSDLGDYIHQTFDINPGQIAVWTPAQFTAVPEPSGGLLTLMGVALLALRRKRLVEVA